TRLRCAAHHKKNTPPYLPIGLGVLILLAAVMVGIWTAASEESDLAGVTVMPDASQDCLITAKKDVNVRFGPGYDYGRAWILLQGEQRPVTSRVEHSWFQIHNGWVSREDVSLNAAMTCANLPEVLPAPLFEDDLLPPDSVLSLGWREVLGESFATAANQWDDVISGRPALMREGELILEMGVRAAPLSFTAADTDHFYTFDGFWSSGRIDSTLRFSFRSSGIGEYQLKIQRGGQLELLFKSSQGEEVVLGSMDIPPVALEQRFVVGVLCQKNRIEIFWNGDTVLDVQHEGLSQGSYAFEAQHGVLHIRRFESAVAPE
ncbi:MAG: SH3 domain-containing protein, partial [Anaerolineae bacterium]|nr:SH3 domain-containing protein [Anaerolineae bacterium]